jgi:hypothetical protein
MLSFPQRVSKMHLEKKDIWGAASYDASHIPLRLGDGCEDSLETAEACQKSFALCFFVLRSLSLLCHFV